MSDWTSYSGKYKLVFWDSERIRSIDAYYITAKNELIDNKAYILAIFYSRKDALTFMLNVIMGVYAIERVVQQIEYDYRESVPIAVHRYPVNVKK